MSDERKVEEVMAHYVRETDRRDGKALGALFTADAEVHTSTKDLSGEYHTVGEPLIGAAGVTYGIDHIMHPNPPGGSSHHTTSNHLVEIDGDRAHLNAQFIVFETRTADKPSGDSPALGTTRPIESGYYDT